MVIDVGLDADYYNCPYFKFGYNRKSRTEDGIDPNQDFRHNLMDQTLCTQTSFGQNKNKIFRVNFFQLSFTFHGGMEEVV